VFLSSRFVFLSHTLNPTTPTYGNRDAFGLNGKKFEMTAHTGTHIDFPSHFFDTDMTASDYEAGFFVFVKPLFVEITPSGQIIKDELLDRLAGISDDGYDILIVKTGYGAKRGSEEYSSYGCGFSPEIADFLRVRFPFVRVFGFDTVSVSSFANRELGREAHRAFLNPQKPILLLEDMKLDEIGSVLLRVVVSPLIIDGCDGAPCTVIGESA
jgi:arylformamidase